MVALALYLSKQIFDTPVSDEIISKYIGDKKLKSFENFVYANWQKEQSQWRRCCTMVSLLATSSQKLQYIRYTLLKPTLNEYNMIKLPRPLYWLYYLLRPVRLIIKYTIH